MAEAASQTLAAVRLKLALEPIADREADDSPRISSSQSIVWMAPPVIR